MRRKKERKKEGKIDKKKTLNLKNVN